MRMLISILFIVSCVHHAFADDRIIGEYEISDTSMDFTGLDYTELDTHPILTIDSNTKAKLATKGYLDMIPSIWYYYGNWKLNNDTLCVYDTVVRTQYEKLYRSDRKCIIRPDGYKVQKKINIALDVIHIKIVDSKNQPINGYKIKYYCDSSGYYYSDVNGDIFIKKYPTDDVYDYYGLDFTLPFSYYPVERTLPIPKQFNDITLNIDPIYTNDFIQVTKRYYLVKNNKLSWLYFKQEGTCFFNYEEIDCFFSFKKK